MKVNCNVSGVTYTLPSPAMGTSVSTHPMLSASIRTINLVQWYVGDWAKGNLDDSHVHLLGLALASKLPVDSIAFPPMQERELEACAKVWHANIERMVRLAGKLESRGRKFRGLDTFRLGMDTIGNFPSWLSVLETCLSLSSEPISEKAKELNRASYKTLVETSAATVASLLEPEQVENMVLRALKSSPLSTSEGRALPVVLADWAAKVTSFPANVTTRWQKMIQVIFHTDYINQILMSDMSVLQIRALEEHLVLNTPIEAVGSSHSRLLMERLAAVIPVIEDFSPEIGGKRKSSVGNAGVIDALLGSGEVETKTSVVAGTGAVTGTGTGAKPMTLSERLALRLANKGSN